MGLPFTEIAGWMNLTSSNLRAMIHLGLNPTLDEWEKFKNGLKNYIISKKNERILVCVSQDKIAVCRRRGCNEQFIKWSWNAKDCEKHRRKSFKKYPIK